MQKIEHIDDINDIMTKFLDNLVNMAKIHTEYKEKLGDCHEYTKLAKSLVTICNQYQSMYVYMKNQEEFACILVELSNKAIIALEFKPYELLEGSIIKRKKQLKEMKDKREVAIKELSKMIDSVNEMIDNNLEEK